MSAIRTRLRLIVLLVCALALVVSGWTNALNDIRVFSDLDVLALITGVTLLFIVPGIAAEWRRPRDPSAWLIVVVGLTVGAAGLRLLESRWVAASGAAVFFATPLLACHLILAYPDGLVARLRRPVIVLCWAAPIALAIGMLMLSGQRETTLNLNDGGRRASSWIYTLQYDDLTFWTIQGNPFHVATNDALLVTLWVAWSVLVIGVGVWTLVLSTRRRREVAPGERRRANLFAMAAWSELVALLILPIAVYPERLRTKNLEPINSVLQNHSYTDILLLGPTLSALVLGGVLVWAELVQPRLRQRLDGSIPLERFTAFDELLRRSLGDPSARILFPRDGGGWVDDAGNAVSPGGAKRAVTTVTRAGAPVAAVEHDTWLLHQPDLVDVTIGSVALTLESQRLTATAKAEAQDIQASSLRLVHAADDARRTVETAIESGPVRTLDAVLARFDEQPAPLQEIHDGLRQTLSQVREIAHELAPTATTDAGLGAMLDAAARYGNGPFAVDALPAERLPAAVEVTIYLLAREALRRSEDPIAAHVTVTDNGERHATARLSGWRGDLPRPLADRIETLRGTWQVTNGDLVAVLPCEEV